ncbi:hypothetical protein NKH18_47015 [Streptomyces sp. M10(2022)]
MGLERPGTWAEQVIAPAAAARVVPADVDAALAATCYSPMTTGWAAAEPVGQIKPGERVLVTGPSGGVGSMTVQLAARAGAHVIALVRNERPPPRYPGGGRNPYRPGLPDHGASELARRNRCCPRHRRRRHRPHPASRHQARRPRHHDRLRRREALTLDLPNLLAADVSLIPMNMVRRHVPDDVFETLLTELANGALRLNTTAFAFTDLNKALEARTDGSISGTIAVTM